LNDPTLCLEAAWNICQSSEPNPEMVEPLIHALKNSSDIALAMVMSALAVMQDKRAYEPIVEYLKSPNSYYRGIAAQCLGTLGDKRAIEHLETAADDSAVAWKEDHGPERRVGEIAQDALQRLKWGLAKEEQHPSKERGSR
jgi:HEAT repeat protein